MRIEYGMDVKNVIIETLGNKKVAKQIVYVKDGQEQTIDLIEDDLVFITNGCCTDTSCYGDQTHAPDLSKVKNGTGDPGICGRPLPLRLSTASSATRRILLRCGRHQLDERHRGHLQRGDHSAYHEHLQA